MQPDQEQEGVLAIDAAWTAHEPSGVALVQRVGDTWTCRALAPSYDAFLSLASDNAVNWEMPNFVGSGVTPAQLIQAARTLLGGGHVSLVTVDMPIATVPITGRRVADELVSRAFGKNGCAAHSPNSERPGSIGVALTGGFKSAGYEIATAGVKAGTINHLTEVYPHPALLKLMQCQFRVPYKVSKCVKLWPETTVPVRISNLIAQFHRILLQLQARISGITLPIPANADTLANLKRFEDALDALVCAWCGIEYLNGGVKPYGDHTAAIWIP
jgi:predicted RNase H-like nuclease